MPPVPDPSSTSHLNSQVEAGLTAVKQGDYSQAIALLESVNLPPEHPLGAKAQTGLVTALIRAGDPLRAARLCQTLQQTGNPPLQEWSNRTLQGLLERHPQLAQKLSAQTDQSLEAADSEQDLTGFQPFVPGTQPVAPVSQPDTGFTPLTPPVSPIQSSVTPEPGVFPKPESAQSKPQPAQPGQQSRSQPEDSLPQKKVSSAVLPIYQPAWRQAGRAANWKPLPPVKPWKLLAIQLFTLLSLYWMVQQLIYVAAGTISNGLSVIPFLNFPRNLINPPAWTAVVLLGLLFIGSRWFLDALLKAFYGLKPLSLKELEIYSPETAKSLREFCQKRRLPKVGLGLLPGAAPIALTYGCFPHVSRIVVSRGLLEQLADDEIAAVFANEVGHLGNWDVPLMSLIAVVLQIPYTLYWLAAEWGNRNTSRVVTIPATLATALTYGVYALLRWVALWLSRERVLYGDRAAAELTGNPNAYIRGLLKIAIGTATDVHRKEQTSYLVEGFDLLSPLGHRSATTLGSLYPHTPLEPILEWERVSPYRFWLSLNNSHPPTGERLYVLTLYAQHWKLDSELVFDRQQTLLLNRQKTAGLSASQWRTLLLQGAPFVGLALGCATAYILGLLGWLSWRVDFSPLAWMNGDPSLWRGLPAIGFSLGTFLRINPFFPDITQKNLRSESDAAIKALRLLDTLPWKSQPIQLEGRLIGRPGIANYLSQDLLLKTASGTFRLHHLTRLGPLGNLPPAPVRPTDLLKQNVLVTGWFRRGVTPWIDLEILKSAGGRVCRSYHPIWSTILAMLLALWGAYAIFRGGIV